MSRLLLPMHLWMIARNRGVGRHFAALLLSLWTAVACAQQFPYVAYVVEPDAYVRSGPGQRYYPTQQLPQGFALEVYRHDGDQWCAVRPPEGSFSWIAAHQVRLLDDKVAEVVAERAVARTGSVLSPARSAVQVLLPRGERVELLAANPTDDPRWLRIIPPAGEFRWIAARQLSRQPPLETTPAATSAPSAAWRSPSSRFSTPPASGKPSVTREVNGGPFAHLQDSPAAPSQVSPPIALSTAAGFTPPTGPESGRSHTPAPNDARESLDVIAGSPAELQLTQFQPPATSPVAPISPTAAAAALTNAPPLSSSSQPRVQTAAPSRLAPRVEELQLRLSQTVVRPPSEWNFDQLRTEATDLLNQEESPRVRTQLRDVLDRIARFERIHGQHAQAPRGRPAALGFPEESSEKPITGLSQSVRQRVREDLQGDAAGKGALARREGSSEEALYDAVGVLKPVVSRREKAPHYALVDDQGDVVSFVTPTPDLNLQPYLGRRIGVHGQRGFMPEYRRAHVTASRVSPIEKKILR